MTKSKRIASTAAAVLMAVSMAAATSAMSVSATAATSYTLTITDARTGHEYNAYQVFDGDVSAEAAKSMTNVIWGNGVNGENLLTALKADAKIGSTFAACTSAQDVYNALAENTDLVDAFAKVVSANLNETNAAASTTATGGYEFTNLDGGYYFVKDKTVPATDAYSKYMLKVVKNTTVSVKADQPKVEKKVYEEDYTNDAGYGTGYNDVADHFIGESVPFKLIGTLPSAEQFAAYDSYYYEFKDTLDAGFKAPAAGDFTVKIGDTVVTEDFDIVIGDLLDANGKTVTSISIKAKGNDIKKIMTDKGIDFSTATPKVTVDYKAVLDDDAVIGLNGNENKVDLKFSNNPNAKGDGTNNTGKTPEDKVIVFTYEFDTLKVDAADNNLKLQGAEFTLQNEAGEYAKVENGIFQGWVSKAEATKLVTDDSGLIKIKGLEGGIYTVTETKAPTDYNLPSKPFTVTLKANKNLSQDWNSTANKALGEFSATIANPLPNTSETATDNAKVSVDGYTATLTIKNTKGAELPETGGIGTKLFYIGGGALVLASAVILISKKRAKDAE